MTIAKDSAAFLEAEMTEAVRNALNIKESEATVLTKKILNSLRDRIGGKEFYIPRSDKSKRTEEIAKEFNGTNLTEVCKKHGVTKSTVYRAMSRQKGGSFRI